MKDNKKYIIIIVILSVLVLALGGFIVYDKVINNKDKNDKKNESLNYWLVK